MLLVNSLIALYNCSNKSATNRTIDVQYYPFKIKHLSNGYSAARSENSTAIETIIYIKNIENSTKICCQFYYLIFNECVYTYTGYIYNWSEKIKSEKTNVYRISNILRFNKIYKHDFFIEPTSENIGTNEEFFIVPFCLIEFIMMIMLLYIKHFWFQK